MIWKMKEKTTNREQALQERMKAETERIVGELCQLYSPEMKDQLEQAYLETVTGDPEKASKLLLDVQAVKETVISVSCRQLRIFAESILMMPEHCFCRSMRMNRIHRRS